MLVANAIVILVGVLRVAKKKKKNKMMMMMMMMAMHVIVTPVRMLWPRKDPRGTQGLTTDSQGALHNAFSWAPRGSSSQSLQDEALLSMDEVAPGAFVMIVVLVVTTVIISPSAPNSFVVVVVVWLELGVGAGV